MNMIHKSIKIFFILLMLFLIASVAYAEEGYTDPSKLNITVDPKAQPLSLYDWAYDYNYKTSVILVDGQPYNVWEKEHPYISLWFKEQVKGPGPGAIFVNVYYSGSVEHDSYDGQVKIPAQFIFKLKQKDFDENSANRNSNGDVPYNGKWRNPVGGWTFCLYDYQYPYGSDFYSKRTIAGGFVDLLKGKDYEYIRTKFTGGKNVGPAKAVYTLKFKGDFAGTQTQTINYKVVPKTPNVKSSKAGKGKVIIKIAKQRAQTDGFKVVITDCKNFRKRPKVVKTKVFKSNKKKKFVIKGLKKGAWYYGVIFAYKTVKGKKYWSDGGYGKDVKVK